MESLINLKVFIREVKAVSKYMGLVFFIEITLRLIQNIYYDGWANIELLNVLFWYSILGVAVIALSCIIVFIYSEKIRE